MNDFAWLENGLKEKGWEAAVVQPLADWIADRPDLLACYPNGTEDLVVVKVAKLQWGSLLPLTREFLNDVAPAAAVAFCHDRLVRSWAVAVFTG